MYEFAGEELAEGKILLFDKDLNWTSFDLVKKVKNLLHKHAGIKKLKVGHAGTLDPLATGLLIICTGKATKQISTLQDTTKEYIATIELGKTTPSFDLETEVDGHFPIAHINRETFEQTASQFVGEISQVPPLYSAIWIDGKRAYRLARNGEEVQMEPRKVTIYEIECMDFALPIVKIRISCSKGTYIRSVARDIGAALNSGGYLVGLRRIKSGNHNVNDAFTVQSFEEMLNKNLSNNH